MEIVRSRVHLSAAERPDPIRSTRVVPESPKRGEFEYVESYSRGYTIGKHDGTLAGLFIGTLAGLIAAMLLGNLI